MMYSRQALRVISRLRVSQQTTRYFSQSTCNNTAFAAGNTTYTASYAAMAVAVATGVIVTATTSDDGVSRCDAVLPIGSVVKEPGTGILFPHLCNAMTFTGCGNRVKYVFVKVYAVGTYMDPLAMAAVKKEDDVVIAKALCNPMYPRTIRIVMNRTLSMEKYIAAIVEAVEPRLNGQDLDKLEEFKNMNPPGDMVEGSEVQMTIRGDTFLYKNSAGHVGAITSQIFCRAMCDLYYGDDPVSKDHKDAVIQGIKKL